MTDAQRRLKDLRERQSRERQRMAELSREAELTTETRAELDAIKAGTPDLERQLRAANVAVEQEDAEERAQGVNHKDGKDEPDAEQRERLELRSRARLTSYLTSLSRGQLPMGVEQEFSAACGVDPGKIPVDLFGEAREQRAAEQRRDAPTPAPGTTGINLDPIFPMIFARAVLPRLSVAMPRIGSGTFATATWDTALTAKAKAKGAAQESTAGSMAVVSSGPHRVTARLSLRLEDIAEIGVENFESMSRLQLMLSMSAELDRLGLVGDPMSASDEPRGLLTQQTDPADPSAVIDFDGFVGLAADAIDGGPWAEGLGDVKLLVNADTMKLAEKTFQSAASYKGETSSAVYLRERTGGFFSSSRMPATAGTIAQTLRVRASTMGLDGVNAMRLATCGVYNELGVDDIYSSSASGIRHFTLHTLITDVLVQQPDAFERVDIKIATP